jgi:hypothetical protein
MDLSELETAPYIAGTLHTAEPGDSISSIMGSSDPAAIGAFMQANDLSDTRLRAGESYLVPEPGSFTAPGARALGQAGLNADNALATQRARDRLDRSMVAIGDTMSGFDPLKGLLATVPDTAPRDAPNAGINRSAEKYHRASNSIDIAGKILDGYEIQNRALGLLDGGRAAAKIGRVTGPLGVVLIPMEHGFEGVSEVKKGAQIAPVAAGAFGKSVLQGSGVLAGMGAGAAATAWVPPAIPIGMAVGGALGGWGSGELLKKTSNEALGNRILMALDVVQPSYDGGVGWPVFPRR